MKKLSDENFTYPAGTSVVSKQGGASDLPEPYAAQRDRQDIHIPATNGSE
jgi:hypothetical protein